ncbi:hypothetical protein ACFQY5_03640 [Paeniroseomonas aquatica]|uniref:Uncharacterized protein n=1 Tax=Paeniroseomonas aquatica TaxID=373043 RepID=A0ABT8A5M5_9PROT|nr:hypothetical protein [Paeniroseomonas aquatica]MDN3564996.1 hypothetical protein [Paeniroseomonas aquatica]
MEYLAALDWNPHLNLAHEYGIDIDTVATDFGWRRDPTSKVPKVRQPIVLQAIPAHPNAVRGPNLAIPSDDPIGSALSAEVEALNRFAATVPVVGCRPPRWSRHFKGDFRLYGRLHAAGEGNYQSMPASERLAKIRIAGEAVSEIDISASHLSIMHGLMGLKLPDGDLYDVPGFSRQVVKAWINATLGKGSPVRKWAKDRLLATPSLADIDPLAVMAAVLRRYPWLGEPWRVAVEFTHVADPKRVLPHMLMGIESDIMLTVVQGLQNKRTLGLPLHDGILVPASAEKLTCDLLRVAAEREASVTAKLTVSRANIAANILEQDVDEVA